MSKKKPKQKNYMIEGEVHQRATFFVTAADPIEAKAKAKNGDYEDVDLIEWIDWDVTGQPEENT